MATAGRAGVIRAHPGTYPNGLASESAWAGKFSSELPGSPLHQGSGGHDPDGGPAS